MYRLALRAARPCHARWLSRAVGTAMPLDLGVTVHEPDLRSKRQRLRDQPVDQKLMNHLHEHGLGRSRRDYKRVHRRFRNENLRRKRGLIRASAPAPFNGPAGSRYATAENWDELPTNKAKSSEVAFVGRSNVGKSTLLNVLMNLVDKPQARSPVSPKPGMTQTLAFYSIGRGNPLSLVDMPGYGFAYAEADKVHGWNELVLLYLRHRGPSLKRVCLLIDSRHGLKQVDQQFLQLVYNKVAVIDAPSAGPGGEPAAFAPPKLQVIFTKCDLVDRTELARRVQFVRAELDELLPPRAGRLPSLMVSSLDGPGVLQLQRELAALRPRAPAAAAGEAEIEQSAAPPPPDPPAAAPAAPAARRDRDAPRPPKRTQNGPSPHPNQNQAPKARARKWK